MMTTASDILSNLSQPGRTLVFCDDTDIAFSPNGDLVPDLRILCAISFSSERYADVATAMAAKLQELGQQEFHATEIVNPKKSSSWKNLTIEQRIGAFEFLRDLLPGLSARFYYIFISKGQYLQLKKQAEEEHGPVNAGHKSALKKVFLRQLFEYLDENTIVVLDQDNPNPQATIDKHPDGSFLEGGGPISAPSHAVLGLQLADMVAFSIGRFKLKAKDIANEAAKDFDIISMQVVAGMGEKLQFLLKTKKENEETDCNE